MDQATDWQEMRRTAFADEAGPPDWGTDIRPMSWNGVGLFGVHRRTGDLHWDGKQVETTKRLATFERVLATIGAIGALLAGIHPFGASMGIW